MSLWLLLAVAAILAGGVAAFVQIVRPRLHLMPLCWGSLAALVLGGVGHAVGKAGAILDLAIHVPSGPDAAMAAMTRYTLFAAIFHALIGTGLGVAVLAVLTAVARSRTRRAASRATRPAEPQARS